MHAHCQLDFLKTAMMCCCGRYSKPLLSTKRLEASLFNLNRQSIVDQSSQRLVIDQIFLFEQASSICVLLFSFDEHVLLSLRAWSAMRKKANQSLI